ncbi:unnamed protein product [Allacma fusca]|uniref:Uncharacterized protein n=1 Tax=Allacma fusca TaxID=39272 RepID=A0A8J2PBM6_9HEXA|nr:unnamed protein product [Allacma fusca]
MWSNRTGSELVLDMNTIEITLSSPLSIVMLLGNQGHGRFDGNGEALLGIVGPNPNYNPSSGHGQYTVFAPCIHGANTSGGYNQEINFMNPFRPGAQTQALEPPIGRPNIQVEGNLPFLCALLPSGSAFMD